jgi:hypothetical protein
MNIKFNQLHVLQNGIMIVLLFHNQKQKKLFHTSNFLTWKKTNIEQLQQCIGRFLYFLITKTIHGIGTNMSIFAKNKNAFCTTNLIIKVRQYNGGSPLFYLDRVINNSEKAYSVVEKLNELAEIEKENEDNKNWKNQYFTTSLTY